MNSLGGRIGNRHLAQHFVSRLQSLKIRNSATATATSDKISEIKVPLRKERSATDILNALEKTISRDPTAPHYKYQDDPYLIPMSNIGKRTFALSKESGRKAAMWIRQEYDYLFQHRIAEPEIPSFLPKAKYTSKDEVSEELLMGFINQGAVSDSLTIYKLLEENVSVDTKQALLEMLCYHNNQEQLPDDLIEERWYRKAAIRQRMIWKDSSEVEQLFQFLKEQDKPVAAAAYNALISGTAKYMKVDKMWTLYEECEAKNIPLNLTSYNCIIQLVSVMKDGTHERKSLLLHLLEKVVASGLQPNIGTLNAALRAVLPIHAQNVAKELTRSLFTEFKSMGVEPSLASYYFALVIFCKERGPRSSLLREILDDLEGKEFTMQDPSDTYFFVTAMDIARNHLQDREVAEKVHKLLLTGENYNFIGESFKESIYYRHYTLIMMKTMPFDEFLEIYDYMVPHVYIPEPSVMEEIFIGLGAADTSIGINFLPRFWSQIVIFGQLERQTLVTKALCLMRTYCTLPNDSPTHKQFAEGAWTYWNFINDETSNRIQRSGWTGELISDVAILLIRGDEFERFLQVLTYMVQKSNSIIGTANIEQLNEMFEACMDRGYASAALDVLQYSIEAGFEEAGAMGKKIQSTLALTPSQQNQLTNLLGKDILNEKSSNTE